MANAAVEQIRTAEADAAKVRAGAAAEASRMTAAAKERGEAALARTEAETRAEIENMRKAVTEKSARFAEKNRAEAEAEAEEIRKAARLRMKSAADEIIRSIDKI